MDIGASAYLTKVIDSKIKRFVEIFFPNTLWGSDDIILPSTGSIVNAYIIKNKFNTIIRCVNNNDPLLAPAAVPGREFYITNVTANTARMYPITDDEFEQIGDNNPLDIEPNGFYHFVCIKKGLWNLK